MSPQERIEGKLLTARTLLDRYGYLLDEKKRSDFSVRWNLTTEEVSFQPANTGAMVRANALFYEVSREVTAARVAQVKDKVSTKAGAYKEQYGALFETSAANAAVTEWLASSSSKDTHVVLNWIRQGNDLVKGKLYAPWGICKCGRALRPARVGGSWKVFDQCGTCYHASKPDEAMVKDEVHTHKVAKPGSAAKRGHGHSVNEGVRPRDRKKGKAR